MKDPKPNRQRTHVVMLQKLDNSMLAIGDEHGQPLAQRSAERLAKQYEKSTFQLASVFACRITPFGIEVAPIPRGTIDDRI